MGQKNKRIGLSIKLNAIIVISILLVSIGLLFISYYKYCEKVDSLYYDKAERASVAISESYVAFDTILHLWNTFSSEEFRSVRERAIAEDNDKIIEDWMKSNTLRIDERYAALGDIEVNSIYDEYTFYARILSEAKNTFGLKSAYLEYVDNGVSYNLVDPDISLREIGTVEEPIEEFSEYTGNDRIPATIYNYKGEWLCTACEPVTVFINGQPENVMQVGVDLDMNDVFKERHWFILNSVLFIAMIILITIVVSMIVTRKLIIKPLKLVSEGAKGFSLDKDDFETEGFDKEDIIDLPIKSNDEIGDLYREIQSMQSRIVDNVNRLTKITAEREKVSTELRMASEIQNSMLPNKFPDNKEFELYASMNPAKEEGGDFYDFFFIDDNHLCLLIADVSGKGVPAALFMMSSKIIIKYRATMGGGTPGEILTDVNSILSKGNESMMFVTVWMGILEVDSGIITCTNAGHETPIIRTGDGTYKTYKDKHGVMVGVSPKAKYSDYELKLAPGDAIFEYTDGVPEANNGAKEMYGMERLEATLNGVGNKSPEDILKEVRESVNEFVDGAEQFDDLTMLCLEYKGRSN